MSLHVFDPKLTLRVGWYNDNGLEFNHDD